MSMTTLSILQIIEIFALYTMMTVLLPAAIFHRKVSGQKLTVRFMSYLMIGNFYLMNLVFLLQLLHISNRYTLWIFTVIPVAVAWVFLNHVPVQGILTKKYEQVNKLMLGQIGLRSFIRSVLCWCRIKIGRLASWLWRALRSHMIEWILLAGLLGYLLWIYGTNALHTFGYCLSDVPVHNFWINAMGENHIFVEGVYPFGFHCVIYYLHAAFGIDTYVLLRLFCLVQTLYVHLMLFAFIKACCKTRFAAYVGVGIYVAVNVFQYDCTSRFYSSIPQEFGMIFILPSIYFALAFFSERKKELDGEWIVSKKKKQEQKAERKAYLRSLRWKERVRVQIQGATLSTWYLVGYAVSFSMTLAVHFYDTIVAGLFCVAIAVAYHRRFFHPRYFGRVMCAFLISIAIAVLPMAAAYAMGTPMQNSLKWGVNVVKGEDGEQPAIQEKMAQAPLPAKVPAASNADTGVSTPSAEADSVLTLDDWAQGIADKGIYYVKRTYYAINAIIETYVEQNKTDNFLMSSLICMAWLLLLALISCMQQRTDYAGLLTASSIYVGLLFLLLGSSEMGWPILMDYNRCRIFLAYSMPIIWSLLVDAPVYAAFGYFGRKWIMHLASFGCCCALGIYLYQNAPIRKPAIVTGLETNHAVICLTNIIHDRKDYTWTIVSASDELNMARDHSYHYETIDFLRKMEYTRAKGSVMIPTQYVYFYIEKVPIDYTMKYRNSGQRVSAAGAAMSLPEGGGLSVYEGENRWIVMSRMYYWAEAYQKMYSNEMKVYYEDDSFVCYQIKQNDYALNNFAIDYGYNHRAAPK